MKLMIFIFFTEKPPTSFEKEHYDKTPSKNSPGLKDNLDDILDNKDLSENKDITESKQRNISQAELESQLFKVVKKIIIYFLI